MLSIPSWPRLFGNFIVLALVCLVPSSGTGAENEVPMQMTESPDLSPDGSLLAFAWAGEIWISKVDGTQLLRVTANAAEDMSPEFSPDGRELAFVSSRTGSQQIFIVELTFTKKDTLPSRIGTPQQVTDHSEGYELHGWFPDGDHVVTTGSRDHGWKYSRRMMKVNVRGKSGEQVLVDAIADEPAVAPDGDRILFVREGERWWRKGYSGERAAQIWLFNIATGDFNELLHLGVDCRSPQWDGQRDAFFFTKGDYKGASLCRYELNKKKHSEVYRFADDSIVMPTISADGTQLLFRHLFDLYQLSIGDPRPTKNIQPKRVELFYSGDSVAIDDRVNRILTSATDVAFSEDGLEILFTSGGDLWAMDTKLKEPVRISETPGFESSPVLGEDAAFVVSVRDGQTDIWKLKRPNKNQYWWQLQTLVWKKITSTTQIESSLRLSPDGQQLYFIQQPGDLMRLNVDGGDVTRIVDGFSIRKFDLSPCGTWLAYAMEDDNFNDDVWITRADGTGQPYNVSKHPDDDADPKFSPDGKILAFTGRRVDTETDIYYAYLQTSDSEETSRERLLDEALKVMEKKRKKDSPEKSKKSDGDKSKDDEEEREDKKEEEPGEGETPSEPITIDFKGLDERLKRLSIPNSDERGMVFSPDSEKLFFSATIDGDSGMYSVTFPDELKPKKWSDSTIRDAVWTHSAGGMLGLLSGKPAKVTKDGKSETFEFSARQTYSRREKFTEAFDQAWRVMRDRWYDASVGGRNWNSVRRKYKDAAGNAVTSSAFGEIVKLMLGELNGSHNGFYVTRDEPSPPKPSFTGVTAHLGVRFDLTFKGSGLKVKDVLPRTPADRVESKLLTGDVVLQIDRTPVDSQLDLTNVLNGPLDRDILLTVQRGTDEPFELKIRPITYSVARDRLYDHWLDQNRTVVHERSQGKLGYLHIRSMNLSSFHDFEKQLYRVGYGRDGLIIDVRDNGGGFTTDLLLTALTQPRHAITVPRDGGPGYPQDRMVFATWQKPIVVLCNQNSFSNAEIFSHAIRNLKRGKLVGVQTAGGVISTGSVQIMDVGRMRMPFRGWFTANDGEDMELRGATPHFVIWPQPGEIPAGKDRQLYKAISVLKKEVRREAKLNPSHELKYNTMRERDESSQ